MLGLGRIAKGAGKLAGLAKKLAPIAPTLAQGIALGTGNPLAAAALGKLAKIVGGEPDDPDALEAGLDRISSEDIVKLKMAEMAYESDLRKAKVELAKAHIEDTQHARATNAHSPVVKLLGVAIVLGFMGICTFLIFELIAHERQLSQSANALLFAVLGYMSAHASNVVNFFYGSSAAGEEAQERAANGNGH